MVFGIMIDCGYCIYRKLGWRYLLVKVIAPFANRSAWAIVACPDSTKKLWLSWWQMIIAATSSIRQCRLSQLHRSVWRKCYHQMLVEITSWIISSSSIAFHWGGSVIHSTLAFTTCWSILWLWTITMKNIMQPMARCWTSWTAIVNRQHIHHEMDGSTHRFMTGSEFVCCVSSNCNRTYTAEKALTGCILVKPPSWQTLCLDPNLCRCCWHWMRTISWENLLKPIKLMHY